MIPIIMPDMSLYIPSVHRGTTERYIKYIFKSLDIGVVSRVDFVERGAVSISGDPTYMAFIHFDYWFGNRTAFNMQELLLEQGQLKIVYNEPYYWIIMINKQPLTRYEVKMERHIEKLTSQLDYLNTVMACHTKKFMDNGITTMTTHCENCWSAMEYDGDGSSENHNICLACGYENEISDQCSEYSGYELEQDLEEQEDLEEKQDLEEQDLEEQNLEKQDSEEEDSEEEQNLEEHKKESGNIIYYGKSYDVSASLDMTGISPLTEKLMENSKEDVEVDTEVDTEVEPKPSTGWGAWW
jgi:hypothetical protein